MRDVDQLLERPFGGDARRERAMVVVGVRGPPSEQLHLHPGIEQSKRGAHIDEIGVAARSGRELARLEHGGGRGLFNVRVIGVERLEQARTEAVTAERDVTELGSELVGEDEARVDDLAVLAVAQHRPRARARDRILHRTDHRGERAHLRVRERGRAAHAHDAIRRERFPQPRAGGGTRGAVGRIDAGDLGGTERLGGDAHRERRIPSHRIIVRIRQGTPAQLRRRNPKTLYIATVAM